VIEWVENTCPYVDYIADGKSSSPRAGAHSRYFPGEWGFRLCRDRLDKASRGDKRKAFDTICNHHSPVFRFFFVERFGSNPQAWYNAKIRFSRSVAVSSMVGHVLGIGDRHGSNILIHKKTGEVVHIDFGIVFEQGKVLNCPEKVPFRLTQNVVDGMGPTGPEGVFSAAAESTLSVLRKNADGLLTILSAVVNDPLYKWSVSPMQARRRQRMLESDEGIDSGSTERPGEEDDLEDRNEVASHAIRRVREKLSGYEEGTSGEQQSIEGQVQFLVRAARGKSTERGRRRHLVVSPLIELFGLPFSRPITIRPK
jgi:ataxia telangiectasia mutated family protein